MGQGFGLPASDVGTRLSSPNWRSKLDGPTPLHWGVLPGCAYGRLEPCTLSLGPRSAVIAKITSPIVKRIVVDAGIFDLSTEQVDTLLIRLQSMELHVQP